MARNIRWFVSFRSQNGTSCVINIYDNDWPAGVTMGLRGAADPFYFEEDDSDDLLNDVMRYRTGYIRIVEQGTFGNLDAIYPTAPFDRYVEVLYGGNVVFNGFIQVQDFSSEQVPVPRVLEFPVISPLGLFEKQTFPNALYLPPTSVSLGELLDEALDNSTYDYVIVPKYYGEPNAVNLAMKVSTLVVSPWDDNFHHSMTTAPASKVMKGESYSYLIEAICKAFGWICHDTPGALIFTAFDYEDTYIQFPVGHIGESAYGENIIISSELDLTDYFILSDNAANMTTLQPDTGIEISYEGDSGNREFTFDHTTFDDVIIMPSFTPDGTDTYPAHAEIFSLCNLTPVPGIWETNLTGSFSFDSNDKLVIGTHCVAWNGNTGVMISIGSYESGRTLFWVRFYMQRRSGQMFSLSYEMKLRKDGAIGGLNYNPDDDTDYYITTEIDTSNNDYVQVYFKYRWSNAEGSQYPQLDSQALIFIHDIKLEVLEDGEPYAEYRYKPASDSDVIPTTGNPAISSDITMPISMYRLNDHLLGNTVRSTKVTTYPYLFQPRKELKSNFRVDSLPSYPYAQLFNYLNKDWRIIAQTFHPWDDEVTLTMQHSSIL